MLVSRYEHADLALAGLQVGDKRAKTRFDNFQLDTKFLGQFFGKIGVDTLDLAARWVAERD